MENIELDTYLNEVILALKHLSKDCYPNMEKETQERCIRALEELRGECKVESNNQKTL